MSDVIDKRYEGKSIKEEIKMDLKYSKTLKGVIVLVYLFVLRLPAEGQTIDVTMRLNTATNQDTVMDHHTVQIRGESTGDVVPAVSWEGDTGIVLQNVGGDYWQTTFQMSSGDTLKFKFWTGFDATTPTFFWDGWEGPIEPVEPVDSEGDRLFIAGNKDTTVALQFYNGTEEKRDQYWSPYEVKKDTFAVYFRVNMGGLMETDEFNPENDEPVGVRGGFPLDPIDAWERRITLEREEGSINNSSFYSGVAYIPDDAVSGGAQQSYKFVFRNTSVWESTPNRVFTYKSAKDTTIHWEYFNNRPPGKELVAATLTWRLKTDGLEKLGFFEREAGDRVVLAGAKDWEIENAIEFNYDTQQQSWLAEEEFLQPPGTSLRYKYIIRWHESRIDASSSYYIPGLVSADYWEEPAVTGSADRTYEYTALADQMVPGDYGSDFQYFNGLPAEGVIETPIVITFNVDMTPATNADAYPDFPPFRPGVDEVWVNLIGCLMPLTQEEGFWDSTPIPLDDPEGDLVYSGSLSLFPPTTFAAGYRVSYSTETGTPVQNGGGEDRGRSYYQFIHPDVVHEDGTIEWPSEFSFATVQWSDYNLTVEEPPLLWPSTGIGSDENPATIRRFELSQNYPNPFNPDTKIDYRLTDNTHVNITVFNLAGQKVRTLVNKRNLAGSFTAYWNGKNSAGADVPSGIYFVRMSAGPFAQTRKMTLIR